MNNKRSKKQSFTAFLIIYSLWVLFYLMQMVLTPIKLTIPPWIVPTVTMISILIFTILVATRIPQGGYTPALIFITLLLGGRVLGLAGSFAFNTLTGGELYNLPFGSIDFFIFNFLALGLLNHRDRVAERKIKLSGMAFISLLLIAPPLVIHFMELSNDFPLIYALIYSGLGSITIMRALAFGKQVLEEKILCLGIILANLGDVFVYINFSPLREFVPSNLPVLLLPLALAVLTYGEVNND